MSKDTHHKEDIDPSEDDLGRGKHLKVKVRIGVVQQRGRTHHTNALTKGDRKSVEDVHGRRKPLGESFIAALRLIEFVGFPSKYGEDSIRRATVFDLIRKRVGSKFFSSLPLVLLQSLIEDWLKI